MEYTMILPGEPQGRLWDGRGREWERWFDGFWRLAGPDDMCPTSWRNLLKSEGTLYDAPPQEYTWKDVAANHAYFAEIDILDDGNDPLRVKGLFTSVDGESLTSASGKIYKRGEAIVVSLREYGNEEYKALVQKVLEIYMPGYFEINVAEDGEEADKHALNKLEQLQKELQASLNAGEKGTEK
jgi:hypothetical protein